LWATASARLTDRDQNVALKEPLVTVLVPVDPAPEAPGAGAAVKLNVPDTLDDLSVAMSERLSPAPASLLIVG
jgi:hypothetical protein